MYVCPLSDCGPVRSFPTNGIVALVGRCNIVSNIIEHLMEDSDEEHDNVVEVLSLYYSHKLDKGLDKLLEAKVVEDFVFDTNFRSVVVAFLPMLEPFLKAQSAEEPAVLVSPKTVQAEKEVEDWRNSFIVCLFVAV